MRLLRYQTDLRSLMFLALALGLLVGGLFLPTASLTLITYPLLLIFGVVVVFWICLLNHNHRHHPIFVIPFLNKITDVLISLCIGAPSTRLHLIHHFNHHRYYDSEKDWSNYRVHAKGQGFRRILHYVKSASKEISANRKNITAPLALKKQQWVERGGVWLFAVIGLYLNPVVFLFLILPSWLLGLLLLFVSNLFNHDECELESKLHHSRNFLGVIENWFFMNNGFHSAHHAKPHMHWSQLPEYHNKHFAQSLPADLRRTSFFVYLLQYVFNKHNKKELR